MQRTAAHLHGGPEHTRWDKSITVGSANTWPVDCIGPSMAVVRRSAEQQDQKEHERVDQDARYSKEVGPGLCQVRIGTPEEDDSGVPDG